MVAITLGRGVCEDLLDLVLTAHQVADDNGTDYEYKHHHEMAQFLNAIRQRFPDLFDQLSNSSIPVIKDSR